MWSEHEMLSLLFSAEILVSGTLFSYLTFVFLNFKNIKRFDQPAVTCQLSEEDIAFGTPV